MTSREFALSLLGNGLRPFPVDPKTKVPLVAWKELQDKPPSEDQVEAWWGKHTDAAVAIVTGHAGGVCALDVDKLPDPKTGAKKTAPNPWPGDPSKGLPVGWVVETPSGGRLHFFGVPRGDTIRNTAGVIAPGVDVRGTGGMAVVYGPNRSTVCGSPEGGLETDCPDWLLAAIRSEGGKVVGGSGRESVDPKAILDGVPEGQRDATLYRYACRLRAQGLKREEAEILIRQAAARCTPAFPVGEADIKLEQAWKHAAGTVPPGVLDPEVSGGDGLYNVSWAGMGVEMKFRQVNRRKDGSTTADVTIVVDTHPRYPFHRSLLFLSSAESRRKLATQLEADYPLGWENLIETSCTRVLTRQDEGQPAYTMSSAEIPAPIEYLLTPWLIEEAPTIFFGPGSSGKSYLALVIGSLVVTGATHPTLGWKAARRGPVLWLDWEDGPKDFQRRLHRVGIGLGIEDVRITYRQCIFGVRTELENLRQLVMEVRPVLIVLDSLSGAAEGDLNTPESALPFFSAFRTLLALNRSCGLIVAHPPESNPGKVFGSVFFRNRARDMWSAKGVMEPGGDSVYMLLRHNKTNVAGYKHPIGLRILFADDDSGPVKVLSADVTNIEGLEEGLSVSDRILGQLRYGAMSSAQIAEDLSLPAPTVRRALSRLYERRAVTKDAEGRYGRSASAVDEERIPF